MQAAADVGPKRLHDVALDVGVEILLAIVDRQQTGTPGFEIEHDRQDRRDVGAFDDALFGEHQRVRQMNAHLGREHELDAIGDGRNIVGID